MMYDYSKHRLKKCSICICYELDDGKCTASKEEIDYYCTYSPKEDFRDILTKIPPTSS